MSSEDADLISTDALRAGDILLSLGASKTSRAIQKLDGGRYSHSALWSGDGTVIESTTPEVVEHSLAASLSRHAREYIDVYRHRTIGDRASTVVEYARRFIGRSYSYGDLALATLLLATTSARPPAAQVGTLKLASWLADLFRINSEAPDEHVTCTELVVRSYAGAKVALRIEPGGGGDLDVTSIFSALAELAADAAAETAPPSEQARALADEGEWSGVQTLLRGRLGEIGVNVGATGATGAPHLHWEGNSEFVDAVEYGAPLVTPRYVATSPDLVRMGRVHPSVVQGAIDATS